jgi:imidazole glycerol-phosphate synthase subunit HisF
MSKAPLRIIARLDIKNENVIKGIHLEGLRVVGEPNALALNYYKYGIDEIIYMDVVASLYGRNNIFEIVKKAAKDIFVPLTVGGGIRTIDDINEALHSGADKVAINTEAVKNPSFIEKASRLFGSQCIVLSIEAIKNNSSWEVLTDNGREKTGIDVIDWVKEAEKMGAGEILLTSVDSEGTQKGFDINLINEVNKNIDLPLIVAGGAGNIDHIIDIKNKTKIDAVCCASIFHYNIYSPNELKILLERNNINIRLEAI